MQWCCQATAVVSNYWQLFISCCHCWLLLGFDCFSLFCGWESFHRIIFFTNMPLGHMCELRASSISMPWIFEWGIKVIFCFKLFSVDFSFLEMNVCKLFHFFLCGVWVHPWNKQHHWFLSCFQSATVRLPILCFVFLVRTVVHSESCSFFWLSIPWDVEQGLVEFAPVCCFFPAVEKMWSLAGAGLHVGLILVSGWSAAHCIYFLGLLWNASFRFLDSILRLIIPCLWETHGCNIFPSLFSFFDFVTQLFSTPVTSSNLGNQAPLCTELRLLQATKNGAWIETIFF